MDRLIFVALRFVMVAFMVLVASSSTAVASDVFVVANSNITRQLTYAEIEDIFTLRNRKWNNGAPIRVYLLPKTNPLTRSFASKYLSMTANRYYDLVEGRESSGKGNITNILDTEYDLMLKVLTTPGSIGYASDLVIINFSGNIVIVK